MVTAPAVVSGELAALGPYFAAEFHDGSQEPVSPWRSMGELVVDPAALRDPVADPADPHDRAAGLVALRKPVRGSAVLAQRVAAVRAYLAAGSGQDAEAVELRVAASVVHLGLVARVVSPLFALAVGYQRCGPVRAADVWWQPGLASTFPLSIAETALETGAVDSVFDGLVAELETAISEFGVNHHILRGNVASALGGAARTLAAAWPDRRAEIRAALRDLLTTPALAGSAELEPGGTLRRRSCCLIYRAAPDRRGALCGDCVMQ